MKSREGASDHVYRLDEGLVEFGTAVNDCDFGRAILFLESLGDKPAAKAMWHNLANIALHQQNLRVREQQRPTFARFESLFLCRLHKDASLLLEMLQRPTT